MSQKQYAAFAANIKSWDALRQKKTNFVPGVLRVEKVILLSKSDFDKLSEDISPDYPSCRITGTFSAPTRAGCSAA